MKGVIASNGARSNLQCAAFLIALALGAGVASCSDQSPAAPTTANVSFTVTFAGLTRNRSPVSTHVENGFRITTVSAAWMAVTTYGNPAPSLQFDSPAGVTTDGVVTMTADRALFWFSSVDLYSSTTRIPFVVEGSRESKIVFSVSDTLDNTFGNFVTVYNVRPDEAIDTLVIRMSNRSAACCSNPMGVDNVVLRR